METKIFTINESSFISSNNQMIYSKHNLKDYIIWCCCCNKKIKHSQKLRYIK